MVFFEKPGCAGNARQKKMLLDAGVMLAVRDMLSTAWTPEELAEFFEGKSVSECFNENAPDIKSGRINPARLEKDEAVAMMIADPILIKRPLIRYRSEAILGFDLVRLGRLIPRLVGPAAVDPGTCRVDDGCA